MQAQTNLPPSAQVGEADGMPMTLLSKLLDALDNTHSAQGGLQQVDAFRRIVAGPGAFSVQLNVTTADDPRNEVQLQRYYSSEAGEWPVSGTKRKDWTPWTDTLFVRGQVFVGEGEDVLQRNFHDFEQMRQHGLNAVINVPLLQGNVCFATVNVFGTRGRWLPQQVLAVRLLALAAARWVTPAPGLNYRFDPVAPAAVRAA